MRFGCKTFSRFSSSKQKRDLVKGSKLNTTILLQGNVGTWDGPAPRGQSAEEVARASSGANTTTSARQPDSTLLPGGASLPLLGFGTYKVDSADVIR